jgi:LmbE family N-acetylglucosaminyl deacetylase
MRKRTFPSVATGGPRAIPDLSLPDRLAVLVLAPHPDDFDAIGITLKFFAERGHCIHAAIVRTGSGVEDAYRPGLTLADKADLREEEQRRSLRFFGLSETALTFLTLALDVEDQPLKSSENAAVIMALLRRETPDVVFMPHGHDTNSGHRTMYALFSEAARQLPGPIAALLNRDPKTIEMRNDLYMPFDRKEAAWKAELLRFHDSQHQRNLRTRGYGFDERILNDNRASAGALAIAQTYAEVFEVDRQ